MSRLLGIQALRAIAAGMVVYAHGLMTYKDKVDATADIRTFLSYGELGVTLFFCISGLIIFRSTANLRPGLASISIFAKKRLIRIVPAYWIATLIYAVKLKAQGTTVPAINLLKSLFFIPYAEEQGLMRPILGAGWTLNYEMLFYTVMAGCLIWKTPWRYIGVAVAICSLMAFGHVSAGGIALGDLGVTIGLVSEPILVYFLIGMGISQIMQTKLAKRLATDWKTGLFLAGTTLLTLILCNGFISLSESQQTILQIGACAASVWFAANTRESDDLEDSFLSRTSVSWGDGSYSTYLTHGFVMGPMARLLDRSNVSVSATLFALLMIPLCSLLGEWVHRKVEQPIIRSLSKRIL